MSAVSDLEPLHLLAQAVGDAVAAADEARAHALLGEIRELALDRLAEDRHQVGDLGGRPRPVLGREGVDRERADAEVDRRLDRPPDRARALPVPFRPRAGRAARPSGRCRPG